MIKTINSILKQNYKNYEIEAVDGKSKDSKDYSIKKC